MMRRSFALAVLVVVIAAASPSHAFGLERLDVMPGALSTPSFPGGRWSTASVWDGARAYVFGGSVGSPRSNEILEYTPTTGGVRVVAHFPHSVVEASAVMLGNDAYVIGGVDDVGRVSNEIWKFTPATGSLQLAHGLRYEGPQLAYRTATSAVAVGDSIFIFGGYAENGAATSHIIRYIPSLDLSHKVGFLPQPMGYSAAVLADGLVYVMGSATGNRAIYVFDPSDGSVRTLLSTLPTTLMGVSGFYDGLHIYVFGGNTGGRTTPGEYSNGILRFTPSLDVMTAAHATLPSGRAGTSAVDLGDGSAIVFGGDSVGRPVKEILRFHGMLN